MICLNGFIGTMVLGVVGRPVFVGGHGVFGLEVGEKIDPALDAGCVVWDGSSRLRPPKANLARGTLSRGDALA